MNKKLVKEFLIITFVIMLIFWGGCALISQIFILTINNIFLRIMHIIGGFSPTIASYISLISLTLIVTIIVSILILNINKRYIR